MIYFNNFDLLKKRKQFHNTCSSYTNTSKQAKHKKKSSEIKKSITLKKKNKIKILEREKYHDI